MNADTEQRAAALAQLSETQRRVIREDGTEPAFSGALLNNHEPGLYVDLISGEALFASVHKYDSGSGWPSFTQAVGDNVVERRDTRHGMVRTEVRSRRADNHLGHLFPDGPPTRGGLRYCINSAALRFIHRDQLTAQGYGDYLHLFDEDWQ